MVLSENHRNYFKSPEEAVEIITDILLKNELDSLRSFYFLDECDEENKELFYSDDYFVRDEKPEASHPGEFWKYRHPFAPGFKYESIKNVDD